MTAQAETANRHLSEQFPGAQFVTSLVVELEVASGTGSVVNAGHPPPLLLRRGSVVELGVPPALPLGLAAEAAFPAHPLHLEPGDRLLLLTDGISEAHRPGQQPFGEDRVAQALIDTVELPPVEVVRRLTRAALEHCGGVLADDATAVCLDWHPLYAGR